MPTEIQVPVTYAAARDIATLAAEASRMTEGELLSTTHKQVLEVVSRRLVDELTPGRVAGLFAVREGDTVVAEIEVQASTLKAYLHTVDTIAAQTPRPYLRASCQRLCAHLLTGVDLDGLEFAPEEYEAIHPHAHRIPG